MADKAGDRVAAIIREVEKIARRLRADLRRRARAAGLPNTMQAAASELRKQAAKAAGQVEKYVRTLRHELEGSKGTKTAARRRRPSRKRGSAKAAKA